MAAPWLADDAAVDLTHPKYKTQLGIGGGNPLVQFVDMTMRLQQPSGDDDDYIEWEVEVGFVEYWRAPWPVLLGQHGFFDRFSVSMHRAAALTVIEDWDAFDRRFGTRPHEARDR